MFGKFTKDTSAEKRTLISTGETSFAIACIIDLYAEECASNWIFENTNCQPNATVD